VASPIGSLSVHSSRGSNLRVSDIRKILIERGTRYGAFHNHAEIAQGLKNQLTRLKKWQDLPPDMREALDMILHKIARIMNGDPYYMDNWVDIVGYAQLVVDRYQKEKGELCGSPSFL
jgi:hypothetical protein